MKPTRREVLCSMCALAVACGGDNPPDPTEPDPGDPTGDTGSQPTPAFDPCIEPGTAAEGWVEVPFSQEPQLRDLLGFAYLTIGGRSVVVAHVQQDCYVALERPCSHEGVPIEYRPDRNGFVCPRHGALYNWEGVVLGGPAPRDLPSLPAGVRGDSVWILPS